MAKFIKWGEEDTQILRDMKAEGKTDAEIAFRLKRSKNSVNNRWRWLGLTDEQKQRRLETIRLSQRASSLRVRGIGAARPVIDPPCPVALAERDRREATKPRDLTAALCGDPRPGFSALDRMRSA